MVIAQGEPLGAGSLLGLDPLLVSGITGRDDGFFLFPLAAGKAFEFLVALLDAAVDPGQVSSHPGPVGIQGLDGEDPGLGKLCGGLEFRLDGLEVPQGGLVAGLLVVGLHVGEYDFRINGVGILPAGRRRDPFAPEFKGTLGGQFALGLELFHHLLDGGGVLGIGKAVHEGLAATDALLVLFGGQAIGSRHEVLERLVGGDVRPLPVEFLDITAAHDPGHRQAAVSGRNLDRDGVGIFVGNLAFQPGAILEGDDVGGMEENSGGEDEQRGENKAFHDGSAVRQAF